MWASSTTKWIKLIISKVFRPVFNLSWLYYYCTTLCCGCAILIIPPLGFSKQGNLKLKNQVNWERQLEPRRFNCLVLWFLMPFKSKNVKRTRNHDYHRIFQPWHYWHFGPDKSSLWGCWLGHAGCCWAALLISTHWMPVASHPSCDNQKCLQVLFGRQNLSNSLDCCLSRTHIGLVKLKHDEKSISFRKLPRK